jgi:hypothetical protein
MHQIWQSRTPWPEHFNLRDSGKRQSSKTDCGLHERKGATNIG